VNKALVGILRGYSGHWLLVRWLWCVGSAGTPIFVSARSFFIECYMVHTTPYMVATCVDRVQEAGHARVAVAASIASCYWLGIWLVLGLAESVKRCHRHNNSRSCKAVD
jgi:hypothetical protein